MAFTYYYKKSGFDTIITVLKDGVQVYQNKSANAGNAVLLSGAKLALKDNYPNQGVETMTEVQSPAPPPPPPGPLPPPTPPPPTPPPPPPIKNEESLKVPKNKIIINKYTSGGEYLVEETYQNYQGYYYEFNNKTYAGKEFSSKASVLIKKGSEKVNTLLTNPSTITYGAISGIKLLSSKISSIPFNLNDLNLNNLKANLLFLCSKINENPPRIKQIDEETYTSLQENPLFKTTFVGTYQNKTKSIEEANKDVPGVQALLTPVQTPVTPFKSTPTNNSIQPVFFQTASLSTFIPNPISTQLRVQDVIPVGPILIPPGPPPPPPPPASAPVFTELNITSNTNNSITITATLFSSTNSTINRIGTNVSTTPGLLYNNTLDTGGTSLGSFSQNRTGLSPQTYYYYYAYAMNDDGFTGSFINGTDAVWTLSNPPTTPVSNLVASVKTNTTIGLDWTPATYPGTGATNGLQVILQSIYPNEPNLVLPVNGAELSERSVDANTTLLTIINNTTTNYYTASGLTPGITYSWKIIPFTWNNANEETYNYLITNAPTASSSTCGANSYDLGDPYYFGDNLIGYVYYKDTCNIYVVGPDDLLATNTDDDMPSNPQWGCIGIATGATRTIIGGGEYNTDQIVANSCPPGTITPYAYEVCTTYIDNASGRYSWYLPTTGDWNQIYSNITTLNTNGANLILDYYYDYDTDGGYWSSVDANDKFNLSAYIVALADGHTEVRRKNFKAKVRPVTIVSNPPVKP